MRPEEIRNLADALEFQQANDKDQLIRRAIRLKNSEPFSQRLNDWIFEWYRRNRSTFEFVDTDDFDSNDIEGTFKRHTERYGETGKIHIWTGASENNIFGYHPNSHIQYNHYFRAWHDWVHITQRLGYDLQGEVHTCEIQKFMLPEGWYIEKELVQCEVVGQVLYHLKHGEFIEDQRTFTRHYLTNPIEALRK